MGQRMNYVSLCSGIGGIDIGLDRAGMTPVAQCEIDSACRKVLKRHWPDVFLHDDITTFKKEFVNGTDVDVVCGGTPCQDLSLAGRRSGLGGERSRLFYEFVRVADELAAPWVLWENVHGVLSSNEGVDFSLILRELTGFWPAVPDGGWRSAGHCVGPRRAVTWRLFDARHFGVPQRRRRVFIVGHTRVWSAPAKVLFEPNSSDRNSPAGCEEREDDAEGVGGSAEERSVQRFVSSFTPVSGGPDDNDAQAGHLIVERTFVGDGWDDKFARTLTSPSHGPHYDLDTENFVVEDEPWALNAGQENIWEKNLAPAVTGSKGNPGAVTFRKVHRAHDADDPETWDQAEVANTLNTFENSDVRSTQVVVEGDLWVRRLSPTECERLQGFDDGWTEGQSDTARYKQLGNAVAVPCSSWIARRLVDVEREISG